MNFNYCGDKLTLNLQGIFQKAASCRTSLYIKIQQKLRYFRRGGEEMSEFIHLSWNLTEENRWIKNLKYA